MGTKGGLYDNAQNVHTLEDLHVVGKYFFWDGVFTQYGQRGLYLTIAITELNL